MFSCTTQFTFRYWLAFERGWKKLCGLPRDAERENSHLLILTRAEGIQLRGDSHKSERPSSFQDCLRKLTIFVAGILISERRIGIRLPLNMQKIQLCRWWWFTIPDNSVTSRLLERGFKCLANKHSCITNSFFWKSSTCSRNHGCKVGLVFNVLPCWWKKFNKGFCRS